MSLVVKPAEFAAWHGAVTCAVSNWKKWGLLVFADDPEQPGKRMIDAAKLDLSIKGTTMVTRSRRGHSDDLRWLCPSRFGCEPHA